MHHASKKIGATLLLLLLVSCGNGSGRFKQPSDDSACKARAIDNEYLVKYRNTSLIKKMKINSRQAKDLLKDKKVDWVEPNFRLQGRPIHSKSLVSPQSMRTASSIENSRLLDADYAWNRGFRGQGIKVAIVDSGVDFQHPLLSKAFQDPAGEWGRSPVFNNIDDDGNGLIDDIFGWNFLDHTSKIKDETGHGTHIAGIIASASMPNSTFSGVAPDVTLIAADFMDGDRGDEFNAVRAIDYALKRGAKIVNNSWSNFCSHSLRNAFESWQDLDVLFVNAAGNDGQLIDSMAIFPSNLGLPNTITVGSVSPVGARSHFSNYGANVMVYAPGEDIYSLATHDFSRDVLIGRSGTSMATAYVSAALALVWSAHPELKAKEIAQQLKKTVRGSETNSTATINVRHLLQQIENGGRLPDPVRTVAPRPRPSPTSTEEPEERRGPFSWLFPRRPAPEPSATPSPNPTPVSSDESDEIEG